MEKNIRRGLRQSSKIVFDSRWIKRIPNPAILREIKTCSYHVKALQKLRFIDKHGKLIDIIE